MNIGAKPRLAFRVGVTGHRSIEAAAAAQVAEVVRLALTDIESAIRATASSPDAALLYEVGTPALLEVVSPLAEGADRLVARVAVALSWRLVAPLPFSREEYEKDFSASVDEFRELLRHARRGDVSQVVELDGSRSRETASYLEAGRFVLANCDLLIAIWDGDREKGEGGSAQIVREAEDAGVPVVWIDSNAPHACRLLLADGPERDTELTHEALASLVRDSISPFDAQLTEDLKSANRVGLSMHVGPKVLAIAEHVEPNFLDAGPYRVKRTLSMLTIGRFFELFLALCALGFGHPRGQRLADPPAPPAGRDNPTVRRLYLEHQRADVLAVAYARLHRSAYMLIYLSGALALACAVASLFFGDTTVPYVEMDGQHFFTLVELILLLGVVLLLAGDRIGRWQNRWLDNRLLAELFRQSDIIAQLGRAFPIAWLKTWERELPDRAWTFRYFRAVARDAGVVGGKWTPAFLDACKSYLADQRIAEQLDYHERNERQTYVVNRRLKLISESFFFATLGCVLIKLFASELAHVLALLAGILPAIAYATFLIRNQAEFEIVGQRSERMVKRLALRREMLARCKEERPSDEPLSRQLGREALETGKTMLRDAADWAGIFAVKETEAG